MFRHRLILNRHSTGFSLFDQLFMIFWIIIMIIMLTLGVWIFAVNQIWSGLVALLVFDGMFFLFLSFVMWDILSYFVRIVRCV